jgi:ribosomal protein S18 acetylase RimI-like enzyme
MEKIFMEYKIVEIDDNNKKAEYTNSILRKLPEWFGIEKGIQDYVSSVQKYPFWIAFDNDNCIGFFSGKIHHDRTGDINVCGIDPNYHREGVGTSLYKEFEKYCMKNNCEYIIVKTVDEINSESHYGKTVKFYEHVGFKKLVTIPEVWDENNPCLIMIKKI